MKNNYKLLFLLLIMIFLLTGCREEKGGRPDMHDVGITRDSDGVKPDDVKSDDDTENLDTETSMDDEDIESDTTADYDPDEASGYVSEDMTYDNQDIAGETDSSGYGGGGYITIVEDDGSETEYYYSGGGGESAYVDYSEDNYAKYTEYQNNLYERQDKIVEGNNTFEETTISSGNVSK